MATARKLDFFTHVFRAEGCHDLPAHVQKADGGDLITTAWELDPEEKAAVLATGLVMVQQIGIVPPMTVSAPAIETPENVKYSVTTPVDDDADPAEEYGAIGLTVPSHQVLLLALAFLSKGAKRILIERVD